AVLNFAPSSGPVDPKIGRVVTRRLESNVTDGASASGCLEGCGSGRLLSSISIMMESCRAGGVASARLEGKVAILLVGTPFVLLLPVTLSKALQSPEDYYERWTIGTLLRSLRYLASFIAVFLPALYIALISYDVGLIPSKLAFSIAATREG